MQETGKRENAIKIIKGVGGVAFPKDSNWQCNVCKRECRSFEETCSYCEHDAKE